MCSMVQVVAELSRHPHLRTRLSVHASHESLATVDKANLKDLAEMMQKRKSLGSNNQHESQDFQEHVCAKGVDVECSTRECHQISGGDVSGRHRLQ